MKKSSRHYELVAKRRTIRLFKQREIPLAIVRRAINAARLAPSAANLQFLEYLTVRKKSVREKIFPHTCWAGYLYPKRTPRAGKRPALYIVILMNKKKAKNFDLRDVGAAAENIILSLLAEGLGSCWIGAIKKSAIAKILKIPSRFEIDSLIAAGFPDEAPKSENDSKNVKYWLDKKGRLHVPKRPLKDIFHSEHF